MGGLEELRQLWISNNQLTGVLPGELADLEELNYLVLIGNSFVGCVPTGLKDVSLNDIDRLGLEDCPAGAVGAPAGLSASLAEGAFSLTWNAVTGAGLYEAQHTTDAAGAESVTWTALEAVTVSTQTYTPAVTPACDDDLPVPGAGPGRRHGAGGQMGDRVGSLRADAQLPRRRSPVPPTPSRWRRTRWWTTAVGTVSATDPDTDDADHLRHRRGQRRERLRPGRQHRGHHGGLRAGPRDDGRATP